MSDQSPYDDLPPELLAALRAEPDGRWLPGELETYEKVAQWVAADGATISTRCNT